MYELFMEDYVNEAICEMNKYINSSIPMNEAEVSGKEGVYKINYYFRDHLQIPIVSGILDKPKNREAIIEFTGNFIDEHSDQLSTSGPVHIFTFGDKETSVLYNLFNINADTVMEMYNKMVEETYYGKITKFITGLVSNAPHKLLITCILIEAIQKKYEDIVTCMEYLWAFSEYALVYRMFWKTGVKEDVMNYTIEHLGGKFKVKKVNNIKELLKYDAHSSVSANITKLEQGVDNVYIDLLYRMRNQIKGTFRNIANAYYKNNDENSTQHSKESKFDDGSLVDQSGHTTNITQFVDSTVNKFLIGEINNAIAKAVSNKNKVDKDNLVGYIGQILSTKNNRIPKFIENIITAYFNKNPTSSSLNSSEFLNFGLKLYRSIGTSKDPLYRELREILDMWMFDIINIREFYKSEPTIILYTRAIFDYVIWMINYYN